MLRDSNQFFILFLYLAFNKFVNTLIFNNIFKTVK